MIGEEHDAAVTVAKMMDTDLLSYVDKQVDKMLETGDTLADFKRALIPKLQKAGWWGKQDVVDPLTGKITKAQLGSASRLENIFRTNLQSAYAVGQWQSIQANSQTAPFLMYDAVEDHRTRPRASAMERHRPTRRRPFLANPLSTQWLELPVWRDSADQG